nr:hypothetical protein [Streptomyces sp. TLI_235]
MAEVREPVGAVREHRTVGTERPFVLSGATPADAAKTRDVIAPLRDAGATWWDESQIRTGPDLDRLLPVLRRIEAGPPVVRSAASTA